MDELGTVWSMAKFAGHLFLLGAAFAGGWYVEGRMKDATIAQMQVAEEKSALASVTQAADQIVALDHAFNARAATLANADDNTIYLTRTIEKEIPYYVTPQTDARFALPCGFVRVHDAAARGVAVETVANPAGKSDGDACEITMSAAVSVIAGNYGIDHDKDNQIGALQGALNDLETASAAAAKDPPQ